MNWKDATSYSRDGANARGVKKPDAFEAVIGPVRIWVGSGHVHYPGRWIAHAYPFFTERQLKAGNAADAKREAFALASKWLVDCLAAFDAAADSVPVHCNSEEK